MFCSCWKRMFFPLLRLTRNRDFNKRKSYHLVCDTSIELVTKLSSNHNGILQKNEQPWYQVSQTQTATNLSAVFQKVRDFIVEAFLATSKVMTNFDNFGKRLFRKAGIRKACFRKSWLKGFLQQKALDEIMKDVYIQYPASCLWGGDCVFLCSPLGGVAGQEQRSLLAAFQSSGRWR